MGVIVLLLGGLYWLLKWIDNEVDQELDSKHDCVVDDYYKKFSSGSVEEDCLIKESMFSIEGRIKIIEENIKEDISIIYGDDWKDIYRDIDLYDYKEFVDNYYSNFLPLGVARILIMSKKGYPHIIPNIFKLDGYYNKKDKAIEVFKMFQRNINKYYPEIELVWVPGVRYTISGDAVYSEYFSDGEFMWDFELPVLYKKHKPPIKKLDELTWVDMIK